MKNYLQLLLIPLFIFGCSESVTDPIVEEPETPVEPELFMSEIYGDNLVETDDLFQLEQLSEGVVFSINENLDISYYSFQGEVIYNDDKFQLDGIHGLTDGMFVSNLDMADDEDGFSRARFALASADVETLKDLSLLNGSITKETMVCVTDIVYDEISYNKTICIELTN
jgi:hypothetical protein